MFPVISDEILLPTAYFPPISYFIWMAISRQCIIEQKETYSKQSIRNHCVIMTANGAHKLSVTVNKPNGNKTKTEEILLFQESKWNILHWRAIQSAYGKSPFFEHYAHIFEANLKNPPLLLKDLNHSLLTQILKILRLNPQLSFTEHWAPTAEAGIRDLRQFDFAGFEGKAKQFKLYYQVFSDRHLFHPNLSILDLIFNEGPAAASYITEHTALLKSIDPILYPFTRDMQA